ncbi:MAG TPA: class I SAM-dependent methyltransferase [Candidatus Saccharimonadales bacterium]|nr:class I SAM-dependent methyltransferase [Candidatus Saccharimonadales bacterium]
MKEVMVESTNIQSEVRKPPFRKIVLEFFRDGQNQEILDTGNIAEIDTNHQSEDELSNGLQAHSLSLISERTPSIISAIKNNYDQTNKTPSNYIYTGRRSYLFGRARLSTDQLISSRLTESTLPVDILDVGTGTGEFLVANARRNIQTHGISAYDYSNRNLAVKNLNYHIGNAENLLELKDSSTGEKIFKPNTMDIIVSGETVKHFVDPLGAIVQMYELLKQNGILAVDAFTMPGIESAIPSIIDHLKDQGYAVVAEYDYSLVKGHLQTSSIKSFIIRKTFSHLNLPIRYNGDLSPSSEFDSIPRAHYSLSKKLPTKILRLPYALSQFIENFRYLNQILQANQVLEEKSLFKRLNQDPETLYVYMQKKTAMMRTLAQNVILVENMRKVLPMAIDQWTNSYGKRNNIREEIARVINLKAS